MIRKIQNIFPEIVIQLVVLVFTAILQAISINLFLNPNHIFTGGFNGIAQLLSLASFGFFHVHINTGIFILLSSAVIGVFGWKMVGSRFTIFSTANSVLASFLIMYFPIFNLAGNILLASLFAGVLMGLAIGISMRFGFSTGGMDIIAMIVQKRTEKSIGAIQNTINAAIVMIAGLFIGWPNALYTLIGIFATGQVIDAIYTGQQKLTALIVTEKADLLTKALQKELVRGITILPSIGAFSGRSSSTLMMVINRVELYEMESVVRQTDPSAFIDIVSTVSVSGLWFNEDKQADFKKRKESDHAVDTNRSS
ncbi:YitT family protein [Oenococcus alcoholitolerans]|uniref:YitT family protein n=1 Tax=Oenococcus alcoholitolerans TaxID=931074 RepID=UPI003F72B369